MIAILGLAATAGAAVRPAVESAGVGAAGVWADALLGELRMPTPVADASRQTRVNVRFIGIQNSFLIFESRSPASFSGKRAFACGSPACAFAMQSPGQRIWQQMRRRDTDRDNHRASSDYRWGPKERQRRAVSPPSRQLIPAGRNRPT